MASIFQILGRKLFQMLTKTVLRTRATCIDRILDRWTYLCVLVFIQWEREKGVLIHG